jgi:hypothetical protein
MHALLRPFAVGAKLRKLTLGPSQKGLLVSYHCSTMGNSSFAVVSFGKQAVQIRTRPCELSDDDALRPSANSRFVVTETASCRPILYTFPWLLYL